MFAQRMFGVAIIAVIACGISCKKEDASSSATDDEKPAKKPKSAKKSELCPATFVEFADHDSNDEQSCTCEEEQIGGAVFGTDVYTEFSSPCAAAVHAGVIKKSGGDITLKHSKGCEAYVGSTKHGITAHGWGDFGGSFFFPEKGSAKCSKSNACPATFKDIKDRDDDTEITCSCAASPSGSVWGSAIYTQDSSICAAALHNGAITAKGGTVTARAAPGCKTYTGSTAHDVTTSNWGDYETSFFFPTIGDGICASPKVVAAAKYKVGASVDVLWNGKWYDANILAVAAGEKYRIHYVGFNSSWDEWVTDARVRPKSGKSATSASIAPSASPAATYAVGDAVNIEWKGGWYPGKIIAIDGAKYRVHYDGYNSSWDESVTPARLKKK
jgi:hypothetical protein